MPGTSVTEVAGSVRYVVIRRTPKAARMGLEVGDVLEEVGGATLHFGSPRPGPMQADLRQLLAAGALTKLREEGKP